MNVPLRERIFHPTYLRLLCLHVRHRGALLTETLAGTGMSWRQLLHEKQLIPFNAARTLILSAKRLTACPSLGLEFGHSIDMAAHGVAGTAVAASRDVSRALEAAIRYRPLRGRAAEFGSVQGQDFLALFMREPFDLGEIRTFMLEAQAAVLDRIMTSVAGERLAGIEYRFPYPPPLWAREYPRWLSGEVRFRAARMEVRVPRKILRLRNVMADERSRAIVALPADRELALQRSGTDFAGQIRRRLSEQQGTYPSVQTIADEFNMSSRTLLRKLKHDGATYQRLLDDARKEAAEWYLLKTRVPVEAIAERLGYVDASGFSRAFRRWFGKPPGKFRNDRRKTRSRSWNRRG
jgi:AraC-like DNA-binding protein